MAVVSRGYELEANAMTRVVLELLIATRDVLADASGAEAERWVRRVMGKGITARVDGAIPETAGRYGSLSRTVTYGH